MLERLKKLFGKKKKPRYTAEQYEQHYELKKQGLERVLGEMHDLVGPYASLGTRVP
jgi:hypothetical protein